MSNVSYKLAPDPAKNTIGYSKNYRIFSAEQPLDRAVSIMSFSDNFDLGSANALFLSRFFRYSFDRANWSLWYSLDPNDLSEILSLNFGDQPIFFEIKYLYDNNTTDSLATPISISWAKFIVKVSGPNPAQAFAPTVYCSAESCPAIVAADDPTFKPYAVDTAIGIARELSYHTNLMFGHNVVYFKTEPDRDGGDFIFKEWTLFKTTARKCVKVMVPNNVFPDNKPNFNEFGVDFEIPFEIHVDHSYFQSVFGPGTQPRKRDYLYFPLTNRMYEIQGSYLFRGFMMEPIYWKIQLTKFQPNADMFIKPEDKSVLDSMILTTEELFGAQAKVQTEDALNKKQLKTISTRFDEVRAAIHPDLTIKLLDQTYNYAPLIEYYYDMNSVQASIESHELVNDGGKSDQYLTPASPLTVYAYEESSIYSAWLNKALSTGDSVVYPNNSLVPVKVSGPKESHTVRGKYVTVEAYKTLSLLPLQRRDVLENPTGFVKMKQSEHAVIYKSVASTQKTPNMTYVSIVKFPRGSQNIKLFDGYDSYQEVGMTISCSLVDTSTALNLTVQVSLNGTVYPFVIGNINYDSWYALLIPVSSQYSQVEVNVYSFVQDQSNIKNFNGLTLIGKGSNPVSSFSFDTNQNWSIPGANYSLCNVRLFNTMVQAEDHEFVISQMLIRDESTLEIIDNARPRINTPFIGINK